MFKRMPIVLLSMLALMSLACSSAYDRVYDDMREAGLTESEAESVVTSYTEQIAQGKSEEYADCYVEARSYRSWDKQGRESSTHDEQEARAYAAACEELLILKGETVDYFEFLDFVDAGYTEQGVRDYFVLYREQIAQGKSEEDAHDYAEHRALLGEEYTRAHEQQMAQGKSEEYAHTYADAYARKIAQGEPRALASAYSDQIAQGKVHVYAASYANAIVGYGVGEQQAHAHAAVFHKEHLSNTAVTTSYIVSYAYALVILGQSEQQARAFASKND